MTVAAVGQFCELKLKLHDDKYTPRPKSSSALIFSDDVEKCVFCWLIRQKLSLFYCNKIVSRQPCSSTRLHRHMQRTAQAVPGVRQRVHFIEFQLDRVIVVVMVSEWVRRGAKQETIINYTLPALCSGAFCRWMLACLVCPSQFICTNCMRQIAHFFYVSKGHTLKLIVSDEWAEYC